jgi:eukaryotic-like serine/threonine-protein kinase
MPLQACATANSSRTRNPTRARPLPPRLRYDGCTVGDDIIGKSLGHFRIVGKLGHGGMGTVYEAIDDRLDRRIALKVLRDDFAIDDARRLRFFREARSAAAVAHPNIATVHEIGETDGQIYIAMELIEGRTLRRVLAEERVSAYEAARIGKEIARGLAKAHEKGIVHRDLKPDNVMVAPDRSVKVLDFGVAKVADVPGEAPLDVQVDVTHEGQLIGTPAYMSPEQAIGAPVDARSDVFAFGVVLYEMVTKTRPFERISGVASLVATACDTQEPPSKRNPLVPAELERIIQKCLEKKPALRYANAGELLADLERIEVSQIVLASQPTLQAQTTAVHDEVVAGVRARKRRPRVAAGVAIGALLVAGGVWFRLGTTPPPPPAAAATTASASVVSTAPQPTSLSDLPAPQTSNPAALAAYQAALQAFRDGNFEAFDTGMRDAVRLDPSFAAGELRVAFLMWHSVRGALTDARAHLQKASRLRSALSLHDQTLLDALEPVINREPPDSDETERRLRAAVDRWPLDAEFLYLLANEQRRYDVDTSLATFDRVLAVDPGFMTAWRQKAQTQAMRGDVEAALASLDECLRRVGGATGCRNERIWINQDEGRCQPIEDDARQMIASDPDSYRGYEALARAAVALDRPAEAVQVLLEQAWRRAPPEVRARDELVARANLAVLAGRFDEAQRIASDYDDAIDQDVGAAVHARAARLRVEIAVEIGDQPTALRVAQRFLNRQTAWAGAPDGDTARMLRLERTAGVLDAAGYRAARAAFAEAWRKQATRVRYARGVEWLVTFASQVESKSDADEALDVLGGYGVIPLGERSPFNDDALGRTRLLGGRPSEAVAPLSRAARMCTAFSEPFLHVRDHLLLGDALAQTGDAAGACAAYADVISRWGHAKPRSLTAQAATTRARALNCSR